MIKTYNYISDKKKVYILSFLAMISVSFYKTGKKITIDIMPLGIMYSVKFKQKEVKNQAEVKIILKNDFIEEDEINSILELIRSFKDSSTVEIIQDYRIRFKIHKTLGSEVIYLNKFGGFSYKGKTYKNEKIKEYVFNLIPECAR